MVVGELAESVDLLVLGGGPGGYGAAIRAAALGRQVTLIDRSGPDALGGASLQMGAIGGKALIELAGQAARIRELERVGLSVAGVEVSLDRFQAWRTEVCLGLARGVARLLKAAGVTVVHGNARFNRPDRVAVRTPQDKAAFFEFEQAIIATGARSGELPGLPFDGERVLDPSGALTLSALPASVAVLGTGYIGLELGTALAKLGSRVTLVDERDRIVPSIDASLTAPVLHRLGELGVEVRLASTAERLDGEDLVVHSAAGEDRVPAQCVVVDAGRVPNTDDLGLAAASVAVGRDGLIEVDAGLRANERIAAVGDVVAGPALAHKASAQAVVAAEALSGYPSVFEPAVIPVVIFSDPEIATVGLTEDEARARGMDVRAATFPLAASGRAAALGAHDGFTRLVTDTATDRIVGVHIVGPQARELAAGGALAVEMMASASDLAQTIHPHPTVSEGLQQAAAMLLGNPADVAGGAAKLERAVHSSTPRREGDSIDSVA